MSSYGRNSPLGNYGTLVRISEEEDASEELNKVSPVARHRVVKNKKKRRHSLPSMKPPTPSLQKYSTQSSIKNKNDDNEDGKEENGVWFWVNKSGFPIDESTWERMWDHVAKNHPGGYNMVCSVRSAKDLPQVSIPQPPYNFPVNISVADKLEKIQNYMRELQYNHTGTQFFEIKKNRPISGLMDSAREMIREALPIKCLEAVILGVFLTNGMMGVERFAISFKSTFGSHVHRHVVLGIYYGGLYGAIGMSRREELMYKPLIYKNLSDLVLDFESNYIKFYHRLNKIKVGLPIPHDPHSFEPIPWKVINVNVPKTKRKDIVKDLDQHSREIRSKARSWSMPASVSKKMSPLLDTSGVNHPKSNQQITKSSPSSSVPTVGSAKTSSVKVNSSSSVGIDRNGISSGYSATENSITDINEQSGGIGTSSVGGSGNGASSVGGSGNGTSSVGNGTTRDCNSTNLVNNDSSTDIVSQENCNGTADKGINNEVSVLGPSIQRTNNVQVIEALDQVNLTNQITESLSNFTVGSSEYLLRI